MNDCNIPNPGSKFAKVLGCTCDPWRNNHGKGCVDNEKDEEVAFFVNENCPVHGHLIHYTYF